jgi:hypothetical protein
MSAADDPVDALDRFLSSDDAVRLLDGDMSGIDDLPDAVAPLAMLFSSLSAPSAPQTPRAEHEAVATIAAAIRGAASQSPPLGAAHPRFRRMSAKATAAMIFAMLASGTAVAAAATGSLPSPIQRAVSNTLAHFDISVPHGGDRAPTTSRAPEHHAVTAPHDHATTATVPALPGDSVHGLCRAAAPARVQERSANRQSNSAAFSSLQRAAAAAGMTVTQYCKLAEPPTARTATTTSTSGMHRKTGTPPTHVPNGPPVTRPVHGNPHTNNPPGNGNSNGNGNGNGNGKGKAKGNGAGNTNGNGKAKGIVTGHGNGDANAGGGSKSKP